MIGEPKAKGPDALVRDAVPVQRKRLELVVKHDLGKGRRKETLSRDFDVNRRLICMRECALFLLISLSRTHTLLGVRAHSAAYKTTRNSRCTVLLTALLASPACIDQ